MDNKPYTSFDALKRRIKDNPLSAEQQAQQEAKAEQQRLDRESAMIAWLDAQEPNTVLHWNTHHFSLTAPYAASWVDVYCEGLAKATGMNWCWTIEGPLDEANGSIFDIVVAFDATLEILPVDSPLDEDGLRLTPSKVQLRTDQGTVIDLSYLLDDEEWLEYRARNEQDIDDPEWRKQRDWHWCSYQQASKTLTFSKDNPESAYQKFGSYFKDIDGHQWICSRVWTPDAVNEALNRWIVQYTDNPTVSFQWNPTGALSPMFETAVRRVHEMADRNTGKVQIAPGIKVGSDVFDALLAMSAEEAQAFVETVRQANRESSDAQQRQQQWFDSLSAQGQSDYLDGLLDPPSDL